MKKFFVLSLCLGLMGCATLGTVNKTDNLSQGMSMEQVRSVLGAPDSSELSNNRVVWKYSLHKYFVGWIPYYLTFNEDNKLVAWAANQAEFYQNQQVMMGVAQQIGQQNQQAQYQRQQFELQQEVLQIERQKAMIQATPRSTHTNCTKFGNSVSCDSY